MSAQGVWPAHVELYFDGQALWVCDLAQKGDVRLNGAPVGEWQQAQRGSQITFASAVIDVLDSATAARDAAALVGTPLAAAAHFGFPSTEISADPSTAMDANTRPDTFQTTPRQSKVAELMGMAMQPEHRSKVIIGGVAAVILLVGSVLLLLPSRAPVPAPHGPTADPLANAGATPGPAAASPFDDTDDVPTNDSYVAGNATTDGGVPSDKALSSDAVAKLAPTLEGQAAALYFRGRYREAIPLYERLAKENPSNHAFSIVVDVLRRELAKQCLGGLTPRGEPCAP